MSSLIRERPRAGNNGVAAGIGVVVVATVVVFALLPGNIGEKSHLALHGLCAQRPSHSLRLGDGILPFDARMTGIYLGSATTLGWLALAGRLRHSGPISRPMLAALASFVAAMAVDGGNGLALDLQLPHLYDPSNLLRLGTGMICGVALGAAIAHLFAITAWARSEPRASVIEGWRDLAPPIVMCMLLSGVVLSGLPILYSPIAVGLVFAAFSTLWGFFVILVALVTGRAWRAETYWDVGAVAPLAGVTAAVFMAFLALLRLAAETWLGLPKVS